jgi:hypothetical protein
MEYGASKTGRSKVFIAKKADDPLCVRVSLGGRPDVGFYCTYRGLLKEAIGAIETVLVELHRLTVEPPISPDGGKKIA